jgi:hypothetical protein
MSKNYERKLFMKKTIFFLGFILFIVGSVSAQVASIVNSAISEYKEYIDPSANIYISSQDRTWQHQLEIILDPRYSGSYSNIKRDFLSYSGFSSLPTYSQVSANRDWMNWWERGIMAQAGRPDGFPHVGGRAVDVSVRTLNNQQKENFARILRNKGVNVIYEYYGGSNSDFHVSISQANLFHCYY